MLAALSPAQYKVTITGGTWSTTGAAGTISDNDPPGGAYGVTTGGGQKSPKAGYLFAAGHGTAIMAGTITAHFEWQGSDADLPPAVIVKQVAMADWSGNSGSCDCGITTNVTTTAVPHGQRKTGVKYEVVQNPPHSFDRTCEPGADVTFTTDFPDDPTYLAGGVDVSYTVTADEVRIVLSGGKGGLGKEFLVGQQCVASLPLPTGWIVAPPTPPANAASYAWSASGADPFKSFAWVNQVNTGYGHRTNLAAGDEDDPTLTCCFAKQGTATVSVTVHLLSPNNDPFEVSAQATASVSRPSSTQPSIRKGKPLVTLDGVIGVFDADGNTTNALGIQWDATVTTLDGFGSDGRWGWVQILTVSSTRVVDSVTQTLRGGDSSTGLFTVGSDGTLPSSVRPGIMTDSDGLFYADGTLGGNFDSPREILDDAASSYHDEKHFEDYLMYRPPGAGSQFVPLYKFTWYYKGDASHSVPNGAWTGSGLEHDATAPDSDPSFPDWSHQFSNGSFQWTTS